jgi:hypothetical protein
VNIDQCNKDETVTGCFWLYNNNDGKNDGSCKAKNDNELGCSDAKRSDQCTASDVTSFGNNCFWIDENVNTGWCRDKEDENLICTDIKTNEQCTNGLSGTSLESKCTYHDSKCISTCEIVLKLECDKRDDCSYIFSNSNNDEDGKCYSKNTTVLSCEDLIGNDQCTSGGAIEGLVEKCDMYGDTCKTKCSELSSDECTDGDRGNDCYVLEGEDGNEGTCVDKVFIHYY